jgi:CheY-like chemotaxis protein
MMTTILLVDDDPLQAYVRRSLLERRFDHVERATDAAEALILLEEPLFKRNLGLVIAGLHLPGMGGQAFVAELISRFPFVPVLVLGRSGEKTSDFPGQNVRFLPRPISAENMLSAARQLLDQYRGDALEAAVA